MILRTDLIQDERFLRSIGRYLTDRQREFNRTPPATREWWLANRVNWWPIGASPDLHNWRLRVVDFDFDVPSPDSEVFELMRPRPQARWSGPYRLLERYETRLVESTVPAGFADDDDEKAVYGRSEWNLWMADSPGELADHAEAIERARGNVLIAGLGLGAVALSMARKPEVRRVDVLEIDPWIVCAIAPQVVEASGGRVSVCRIDAKKFKPRAGEYDLAWVDIWRDWGSPIVKDTMHFVKNWMPRVGALGLWALEASLLRGALGSSKSAFGCSTIIEHLAGRPQMYGLSAAAADACFEYASLIADDPECSQ